MHNLSELGFELERNLFFVSPIKITYTLVYVSATKQISQKKTPLLCALAPHLISTPLCSRQRNNFHKKTLLHETTRSTDVKFKNKSNYQQHQTGFLGYACESDPTAAVLIVKKEGLVIVACKL